MSKFVDIHTHNPMAPNNDEILSINIINIEDAHTSLTYPKGFFCLGIHPWHISHIEKQQYELQVFEKLLSINLKKMNFFALGEIGLDKPCSTPFDRQLIWFKYQLTLAVTYKINLIIIHCVKSYDICYQEILKSGYKGKILLHGFKPNLEIYKKFSNSFITYISINSLYLQNLTHIGILSKISIKFQFLETDDNQNLCIKDIYHEYCKAFNYELVELVDIFYDNFNRLHCLSQI